MIEPEPLYYYNSFDLLLKLKKYNDTVGEGWGWFGQPMKSLEPIRKRLKREQKAYGNRLLAYKIVLMQLDQKTGEIEFGTVEEG
jgi:hypothetical protein